MSERYCRVLTLMDPAVNIGVLDSTTLDTGILTGDAAMSEDNTARLTYLRLQSEAAAGDPSDQRLRRADPAGADGGLSFGGFAGGDRPDAGGSH